MKNTTKQKKENIIINAAESVFAKVGFKNARMEDIAAEAHITKVTLYSYFQSKDNLIMAVTFKALSKLEEAYNETLLASKNENGLELTLNVMGTFIQFCEANYFYSEALLEYFAMVRSTSSMTEPDKMTDAVKDSDYLEKLKKLQNYPFKTTAAAIEKGIKDGSIHPDVNPMFATLNVWIMVVGYVKVLTASGDSAMPLFHINIGDIKKYNVKVIKAILQGKVTNE